MQTHKAITIAMSNGARAEETAFLLADRLAYRYVDDQILAQAAERAGVSTAEIDAVEHVQPLLARVLTALGTYARPAINEWSAADFTPYEDPSPIYQRLIQEVVREVASAGKAVIVAHGAGILLRGVPDVLRVFVTASPDVRAQRIAAARNCSVREAETMVRRTDDERAAYLQRFFRVSRELPFHYDLVVSTDSFEPADAARIIASAAGTETARAV